MRLSFVLSSFLLLVSTSLQQAWAQVVAPSKGGDVSIVEITPTSMTLTVGRSGNGQGRMVAIAASPSGMPVMLAPSDNQFYTSSSVYGQGNVVGKGYAAYSGTDHSVIITGLQPNTYYYITSSEYNTDNTSIVYNTTGTSISVATRKAPPTPLPVTLVSFTGTINAHSVAALSWVTASEYQSAYFVVERSADGLSFSEASKTWALGNSTQEHAYQWIDPQSLQAATYYRLRQVDQDGTTHYSGVVLLQPVRLARQVSVYPNPGTGRTMQLSLQGYEGSTLTVELLDALGRVVLNQPLMPASSVYLAPVSQGRNLIVGTYVLRITGAGFPVQQRITITD